MVMRWMEPLPIVDEWATIIERLLARLAALTACLAEQVEAAAEKDRINARLRAELADARAENLRLRGNPVRRWRNP